MSYLASSSASFAAAVVDIATQVATHASWAVVASAADGTGTTVVLQHSGTSETISMKSAITDTSINEDATATTGFGIMGGTGYNAGGSNWKDKVTGGPVDKATTGPAYAGMIFGNIADTTVNWFVFINADLIWITTRVGDYYQHATFGQMEKVGTWTGGFCFGATISGQLIDIDQTGGTGNRGPLGMVLALDGTVHTTPPNMYVRCTEPATASDWQGHNSSTGALQQINLGQFSREPMYTSMGHSPNLETLNAHLFSLEWEWYDTSIADSRHIANLPTVFVVSLYALNAEQQVVVGGKTYVVFPMIRRLNTVGTTEAVRRGVNGIGYSEPSTAGVGTNFWGYAVEKTA